MSYCSYTLVYEFLFIHSVYEVQFIHSVYEVLFIHTLVYKVWFIHSVYLMPTNTSLNDTIGFLETCSMGDSQLTN